MGGPYDLCAAGRYWCHDAKYRREKADAALLKRQLERVAQQAGADNFDMGERYDMNYIYYNTGEESKRNWHGSPSYYEYPNVFLDVLVHDFLGLRPDEAADLLVAPCCPGDTQVSMASFGVAYRLSGQGFSIRNISGVSKRCVLIYRRFLPVGRIVTAHPAPSTRCCRIKACIFKSFPFGQRNCRNEKQLVIAGPAERWACIF